MTKLILLPKGKSSFKLVYSISFNSDPKTIIGRNEIALTEMCNAFDAQESFKKYLDFLFPEEVVNLFIHKNIQIEDYVE